MSAGEPNVTLIGNLTADPELRFTASGAAVANFTVASTPRFLNKSTGEWEDGETLFMRCNVWREAAENVAESLVRGARVIVAGRLRQRKFTTKEGEDRTVIELEVDEIGPSVRYATVRVTKKPAAGNGGGQRQPARQGSGRRQEPPMEDPWGSAAGTYTDEPPF